MEDSINNTDIQKSNNDQINEVTDEITKKLI